MTEPNGFYYMRARYYDPQVGRFISEDREGFDGGDVNLMTYVGNNPIMRLDPSGLSVIGKIWNPPNTLLGLAWGGLGMLGGANASIGNNAIQFENHPLMPQYAAITIGNILSYAR